MDTTTPAGRALMKIQAAGPFAETESNVIRQRVHEGIIAAQTRVRKGGAPVTAPWTGNADDPPIPSGRGDRRHACADPPDAAWATTHILDAQAIEAADFDPYPLARFRHVRILSCPSSNRMLHTVLERFAEFHIECLLGYSRVVNNVDSIVALQTVAMGCRE